MFIFKKHKDVVCICRKLYTYFTDSPTLPEKRKQKASHKLNETMFQQPPPKKKNKTKKQRVHPPREERPLTWMEWHLTYVVTMNMK